MTHKGIVIIDYGSQYTQLIARRVRELNVYSEILAPDKSETFDYSDISGIILSGGPNSVYDDRAPKLADKILKSGKPILGICYGMQLLAYTLDGKVIKSKKREFGKAVMKILSDDKIFYSISAKTVVWMSHSDKVVKMPAGYEKLAVSENTEIAAMKSKNGEIYAFQFHPEVIHTLNGKKMISNFVLKICESKPDWTSRNFIERTIEEIKATAEDYTVISGISGGVDSTVASVIAKKAIGRNFKGFLIDTGLLRLNEGKETVRTLKKSVGLDVEYVDASKLFLSKLKDIKEPEMKRKIIGKTFIDVFQKKAEAYKNAKFLVQGTIYPDRIESNATNGPSSVIKTHHNVGGLPKKMKFKLIEPLKDLFKDEVREVGLELGIPNELLMKHPFPGPGLAIRIIGDINRERIEKLQRADLIFIDTLKKYDLYRNIWQAFAVYLPVKSVGVMGDERTYDNVIVLRAVTSVDGMTADWYDFPRDVLHEISTKIINEVNGINRVVYDISTKPPSTIEWE